LPSIDVATALKAAVEWSKSSTLKLWRSGSSATGPAGGLSSATSLPTVEVLKDDYARTLDVYKVLVDIRFRLLALVPVVTAIAVGLVGKTDLDGADVAVAALGLVATVGIIVYEIRNSQMHDSVLHRLKFIEALLAFPPSTRESAGGFANERPGRLLFLGFVLLWHDSGTSDGLRGIHRRRGLATDAWVRAKDRLLEVVEPELELFPHVATRCGRRSGCGWCGHGVRRATYVKPATPSGMGGVASSWI
jgi:hypothetical protein